HSCSVRQIGQWTRAKKTGVASKLLRSVTRPVGMSRPVSGHLTMTAPIGLSCSCVVVSIRYAKPVKIIGRNRDKHMRLFIFTEHAVFPQRAIPIEILLATEPAKGKGVGVLRSDGKAGASV